MTAGGVFGNPGATAYGTGLPVRNTHTRRGHSRIRSAACVLLGCMAACDWDRLASVELPECYPHPLYGPDEPSPQPTTVPVGTWSLRQVDGKTLPLVVQHTGQEPLVELLEEILTIAAMETFTRATTLRTTAAGQVTSETMVDSGSWSWDGYHIRFVFEDGAHASGSRICASLSVWSEPRRFSSLTQSYAQVGP
jgi:hypothetical protein